MRIKHNGVAKEISRRQELPLLGLGTQHFFEVEQSPRVVLRVLVEPDGYRSRLDRFQPNPNPDGEKLSTELGLLPDREALWRTIVDELSEVEPGARLRNRRGR